MAIPRPQRPCRWIPFFRGLRCQVGAECLSGVCDMGFCRWHQQRRVFRNGEWLRLRCPRARHAGKWQRVPLRCAGAVSWHSRVRDNAGSLGALALDLESGTPNSVSNVSETGTNSAHFHMVQNWVVCHAQQLPPERPRQRGGGHEPGSDAAGLVVCVPTGFIRATGSCGVQSRHAAGAHGHAGIVFQ